MDWRNMIEGGKTALTVVLFFIAIIISVAIISFVGLFVGGSLQTAGDAAGFSTDVATGFNSTVTNLISNVGLVQSPVGLFGNLLSVMLILAVFAGFVYVGYKTYSGKKKKKGGGGDMGY